MYSRILCILLTLLAVLPAFSQKRCRIFGLVRDDAGLPIELAAVRVLGTLNATTTNLQGQYSIYVQADDSLTLQYSMIGYETRKRTINRPQADSLRLDVTLPVYGNVLGTAEVKGQGVQSGSTQKLAIPDSRTTPPPPEMPWRNSWPPRRASAPTPNSPRSTMCAAGRLTRTASI